MENWTIQKLLNWVSDYLKGKGVDSPRLSAELLLSYVLTLKRIELYTKFDQPVQKDKLDILHDLVRRAGEHEPIAYLTGKCEFCSIELEVCRDCLIPRPETELLVEQSVNFLRGRQGEQFVCDLCTGCGCIAVAIAKNIPNCTIAATDVSESALAVAAKNVSRHNLSNRITLLCGDLFEPVVPHLDADKFDLIVSNPPYVSIGDYDKLTRNIREYEPPLALRAGRDGLDAIRRIMRQSGDFLKTGGGLMLEIGDEQAETVQTLLEQSGNYENISAIKDLNGISRIATAFRR